MISITLVRMELARQLRRRRAIFFVALAAMPVVLAVIWMLFRDQSLASESLGRLEVTLYLYLLIPFLALFFAGGLVSEEVRSQTLTYLLVRPVSRWTVLISKFTAYVILALVLVAGSLLLTVAVMWLMGGGTLVPFDPDAPDRWAPVRAAVTVTLAGVLAYGAFFTALGVFMAKPAIPGAVIILVWESVVSTPSWILENFTLNFYLRSLFGRMTDVVLPEVLHLDHCSLLRAALTLALFASACLLAGWWKLSRIEFKLND